MCRGCGGAWRSEGFSGWSPGETRGMNRQRSAAVARPVKAARVASGAAARGDRRTAEPPSALVARPGGRASALAGRLAGLPPLVAFILTTLIGYALLAAAAIGLGFLLVDVLLPVHAIGHSDEAVNEWLADNRSGSLSDASYIGSSLGDIPFIPGLVILAGLAAALLRRWRAFGLIVGAILVELATYRLTSLIVHRRRPDVPRMDHLPVNQSYPSGHVAASVVVYIGLALLLTPHVRSRGLRIALWALAVALPLAVAISRMYRGMHHPIDATAGVLIGLGALAIAIAADRVAGDVARRRASAADAGVPA
jgi:membrane-associated phospholipid phosphatase